MQEAEAPRRRLERGELICRRRGAQFCNHCKTSVGESVHVVDGVIDVDVSRSHGTSSGDSRVGELQEAYARLVTNPGTRVSRVAV